MEKKPKKKLNFSKALDAGRTQGSVLKGRLHRTEQEPTSRVTDAAHELSEAEKKVEGEAKLWEREWASMTLRGVLRSLGDDQGDLLVRCAALSEKLRALDEKDIGPIRQRLVERTLSADDFKQELRAEIPSAKNSSSWSALRLENGRTAIDATVPVSTTAASLRAATSRAVASTGSKTAVSASAQSSTVANRSAGVLARARSTVSANCAGRPGRAEVSGRTGSTACRVATTAAVGPVNGGSPANISYNT